MNEILGSSTLGEQFQALSKSPEYQTFIDSTCTRFGINSEEERVAVEKRLKEYCIQNQEVPDLGSKRFRREFLSGVAHTKSGKGSTHASRRYDQILHDERTSRPKDGYCGTGRKHRHWWEDFSPTRPGDRAKRNWRFATTLES